MTLLPFQTSDVVIWQGLAAIVVEVRGERIALRTADGMDHITTEAALRSVQSVPRARDNLA